ncbi:MAG: late competence development ComFB family protein [Sporolactobacillus sp.]
MVIHNVMEEAVQDLLERYWDQLPLSCHCETCKADVFALCMNQLQPRYASHSVGSMYAKANLMTDQARATILTAITESAKTVSTHPHH